MTVTTEISTDNTIRVLDHGFVRLDGAMADDLSVVNGARVSFARRKEVMDESDEGLIRFLMRDRHGSPFEHNAFRFHVRCPIFVAREVARAVLPVGAYTEFYWTVNARSLMNFLSLRNAEMAQREIRRYAEAVETFLAELMPVTHAAFVANDRAAL